MKTAITRILAALFLLAVFYFMIADGMINHFNLSRGNQYAFNMGSVFILIPLGLHFLLGMNLEDEA